MKIEFQSQDVYLSGSWNHIPFFMFVLLDLTERKMFTRRAVYVDYITLNGKISSKLIVHCDSSLIKGLQTFKYIRYIR